MKRVIVSEEMCLHCLYGVTGDCEMYDEIGKPAEGESCCNYEEADEGEMTDSERIKRGDVTVSDCIGWLISQTVHTVQPGSATGNIVKKTLDVLRQYDAVMNGVPQCSCRGFRITDGKPLVGNVIQQQCVGGLRYFIGFGLDSSWRVVGEEVKPGMIDRCTGWTDRYDRAIYENDICELTIPDGTTRRFIVRYGSQDRHLAPLKDFIPDGNPVRISGWYFEWNEAKLYPTVHKGGVPDYKRMKVIGNVHYDKHLLNDEED